MDQKPPNRNHFEFGLVILNTRVVGIEVMTESRAQNWAVTALLFTLLLTMVVGAFAPAFVDLIDGVGR